jgi:hypothetical protein
MARAITVTEAIKPTLSTEISKGVLELANDSRYLVCPKGLNVTEGLCTRQLTSF